MTSGKVYVLLFLLVQLFCIFGDNTKKLSDHQSPPERRVYRSTPTEFFFDDEPLTSVRNERQFNKSLITWRISHSTNQDGLAYDDIVPVIKNAFRIWSAVTPLEFQQATENADIDFYFSHFWTFESHVLAYCTSSQPIGIHFNENVDWAIGKVPLPFIDLYTALIHEIGHALGLNHSDNSTSVMYRKYNGRMNRLTGHDIRAIRELYGTKENPKIPVSQSPPITASRGPAVIRTTTAPVTIKPHPSGNASCEEGVFYCAWELAQFGYTNAIERGLYKCNNDSNGHHYKTCESNCIFGNNVSSYCSCTLGKDYCGHELILDNFNFQGLEKHTLYRCEGNTNVTIREQCTNRCYSGACDPDEVNPLCLNGIKYCGYELVWKKFDIRNLNDLFECTGGSRIQGSRVKFLETCSSGCKFFVGSFCDRGKMALKPT